MSRKSNTKPDAKPHINKCRDCQHAVLHQYGNDPLLAFCTLKPTIIGHLPFQVEVANALWNCPRFLKDNNTEKKVMKLFKTRSNPKACYVTSQQSTI